MLIIMYDHDLNLQSLISLRPLKLTRLLSFNKAECVLYSSDGDVIFIDTD